MQLHSGSEIYGMLIEYGFDISCVLSAPTVVHTLLDVSPDARHRIRCESDFIAEGSSSVTIGVDAFGNRVRRMDAQPGVLRLAHRGIIEDIGVPQFVPITLQELEVNQLPDEVLQFLLPSRYCESDQLSSFAWSTFGHVPRGAQRVQAVCNWVNGHLTFGYGFAQPTRTAIGAFHEHVGVCRDFAHLAVTLCRALNIPARYVNGYLGDIGIAPDPSPMDFNAWFEVYLDGGWHTFDARHNTPRIGRIVIARGRDAADVAMIHTFGPHMLQSFKVITHEFTEAAVLPQRLAA